MQMTIEEEQKNIAEYEAEAMYVTHEYGPLMELYDAVEASNRAFQEQCREVMKELETENAGDC